MCVCVCVSLRLLQGPHWLGFCQGRGQTPLSQVGSQGIGRNFHFTNVLLHFSTEGYQLSFPHTTKAECFERPVELSLYMCSVACQYRRVSPSFPTHHESGLLRAADRFLTLLHKALGRGCYSHPPAKTLQGSGQKVLLSPCCPNTST